jgi:hypothetical protein
MIKQLLFFRNGNVWASDERGDQVAQEQEPAWWTVIQDKLARGVIDEETVVIRDHYCDLTVGEIVRSQRRVLNQTIFQPGKRGEVKKLNDKYLKIEIAGEVGADVLPTEISRFQERFQELVTELKDKCGWNGTATFAIGAKHVNLATPVHAGSA